MVLRKRLNVDGSYSKPRQELVLLELAMGLRLRDEPRVKTMMSIICFLNCTIQHNMLPKLPSVGSGVNSSEAFNWLLPDNICYSPIPNGP